MTSIEQVASDLVHKGDGQSRFLVAVAGPPGSGKSTFSQRLCEAFKKGDAAVFQMDGFHYDNAILDQLSLRERKGAPETFDVAGYAAMLRRIRGGDVPVTVPVFDRPLDLARAGAVTLPATTKFVIVEGNYLLLAEEPWAELHDLFDYTIFLDVDRSELERRLLARWLDLGLDAQSAQNRVVENDMLNVERVLADSAKADMVFDTQTMTARARH